jgi:hypothetical protein
MKRLIFLFVVVLSACIAGSTGYAQFTTNYAFDVSGNHITKSTNTTALTPIGNGWGVALLGYGLPLYNDTNLTQKAETGGAPSACDATVANGQYQFYVVGSDFRPGGGSLYRQSDYYAMKVTAPLSNPRNLTIVRTWLARIETNNVGSPQAGSFAACGITTNGTAVLRCDASSSPNGGASYQALFVFNAETNATVVITQVIDNVSLTSSLLVTQDGPGTLQYGSLGMHKGLFVGASFTNAYGQFAARLDISGTPGSLWYPHGQSLQLSSNRGNLGINDTARVIAYWAKTDAEIAFGSGTDINQHLMVIKYGGDSGGAISGITSNLYEFGSLTTGGAYESLNTNAIDFFSAIQFNGPGHFSINDHGEITFPVSIDCTNFNASVNGTRSATITGILWKEADTGTFRKVVDNQDTTLFAPAIVPGPGDFWTETNNLVSPPALDNFGNVFFECGMTNFLIGGTNAVSDVALYQSIPNQYPNPTSWTTRALLREGWYFVEPTSGQTIKIVNIPKSSGAGTSSSIVPRAFGASAINRVPVPGTTNTLGGVVICAGLSNLVTGERADGIIYVAPLPDSLFKITQISRSGNNVTVAWNGVPGSNIVQRADGGNFATNNFSDLASVVLTGSGIIATNYTDVGGATGSANRYYRIKLLQ